MKKAVLTILCLLALAFSVKAQESADSIRQSIKDRGVALRMAYDDYKSLYNPRDYVRQEFDPFSPVGTGIASFFITGLGQMINGEVGRGFAMLGGDVALVVGGILGFALLSPKGPDGTNYATTGAKICLCCGLAGSLGITIWSICDAVDMAKIKNLYYRDCQYLGATTLDVKLMPSFSVVPTSQSYQYAPGVTLAVRF